MRALWIACLTLAGIANATPAEAEVTKTFAVSAQLVNGCTASTDGSGRWGQIDLGHVDGATVPAAEATLVSAQGAGLTMECTPGVVAALSVDNGEHAANGLRMLARPEGGAIAYHLFANGAAVPWTTQTVRLIFTSAATRLIVPITARTLPAGPLAAGTYTDTVRITLSW